MMWNYFTKDVSINAAYCSYNLLRTWYEQSNVFIDFVSMKYRRWIVYLFLFTFYVNISWMYMMMIRLPSLSLSIYTFSYFLFLLFLFPFSLSFVFTTNFYARSHLSTVYCMHLLCTFQVEKTNISCFIPNNCQIWLFSKINFKFWV